MRIHIDYEQNDLGYVTAATEQTLSQYAERLCAVAADVSGLQTEEASIRVPYESTILEEVQACVDARTSETLKYIFLVGIGGSDLGTLAIMNALHGRIARPGAPEIINLDTVHGPDIEALQEMLSDGMSPEQYLVFVVTKSGTTTETLANAEALLTYVLPDTVITHDRLIVITDPNSCLANAAASLSVPILTIPEQVGGRFSVFTAVGLAPLHAAGIDVVSLLQGARDIQPFAWHQDPAHNPAMQCAVRAYNAHEKGYTVYDTFVFAPQLELLGKWCRQLLGESLGKVRSTEAGDTPVGMVPTVSVGSTDLHSVGQFYLGGQPTVFTNFVHNTEPGVEFTVPETAIFTGTNPMIHGRTNIEIMNAIFIGTQEAYNEAERPFVRTELTGVTSYELGAFMQCKMLEVMYLAQLLEVNAFNQPHVESYKKFTRNRLEQ